MLDPLFGVALVLASRETGNKIIGAYQVRSIYIGLSTKYNPLSLVCILP